MSERFTVYGLECILLFKPIHSPGRALVTLDLAGEFEVHAVINGEEFTLTRKKRAVTPKGVPEGEDVEIVIHFVRLAPISLKDASALPELLLKSHLQKTKALRAAEGEAKRLDGELQKAKAEAKGLVAELAQQKGCRQESEANATRLAVELETEKTSRQESEANATRLAVELETEKSSRQESGANATRLAVELETEKSSRQESEANATRLAVELETEKSCRGESEAEAQRLAVELETEKSCRGESEAEAQRLAAEVDRCHALIAAESHQAAERECRLTGSVVKIQAKWRQVLTRRWFLQERSERAWRRKQAKRVRAILCLQSLWRLKQKKCQRRWLRAQNGCFNAETPYDAILACMTLLTSIPFGSF